MVGNHHGSTPFVSVKGDTSLGLDACLLTAKSAAPSTRAGILHISVLKHFGELGLAAPVGGWPNVNYPMFGLCLGAPCWDCVL